MRLRLDIAGGFAAPLTSRRYEVDLASLPEERRKVLEGLVVQALSEPPRAANPRLRDAMSYELTITSDTGEQTLVGYDGAMPPRLREVIDVVKSIARP